MGASDNDMENINPETCWQAVQQRDDQYDGAFVYAVKTTGVYCRPTCASRRPHRKNVDFFADPAAAEQAGYRACKRCTPNRNQQHEPHLDLIVAVCRYLEAAQQGIPTLDELGKQFNMSPFHLQRTFKRVVGVTPRQYADAHRQGRLRALLRERNTVTEAIFAAGYESVSQVYGDDALGMVPIHYREGGDTLEIIYTVTPCTLGHLLVAATERGVCKVSLADTPDVLLEDLHDEFPQAVLTADDSDALTAWVDVIAAYVAGQQTALNLPLDIQATSFQRRVWAALRSIPYGDTRTYTDVAEMIGQPTAVRAVSRACATNPVAMVIPCHRVVGKNGTLNGYRWGLERKRALLEQEQNTNDA